MTSKKLIQIIKEAKEGAIKHNIQQDENSFILGWLLSALISETTDIKKLTKTDYPKALKKRSNVYDEISTIL